MLNLNVAILIAEKNILDIQTKFRLPFELALVKNEIIEKPYGWVFFYTSKKYLETDDLKYAIVGNGPFLIEKETGKIILFDTTYSIDFYIQEYEKTGEIKL